MIGLYDTDATAWAESQADALRRRAPDEIDWDNVAEEIADVAQRNRDRIESALVTAIVHLLKWQHQDPPRLAADVRRSNAWKATIIAERNRIVRLVRRNPSLAGYPAAVLAEIYPDARDEAKAAIGIAGVPAACPWTTEQVLDPGFWPDAP